MIPAPFVPFALQRRLAPVELKVRYNLAGSGFPPVSARDVLTPDEQVAYLQLPLGYGDTEGSEALRETLARQYPGATSSHILVTTGTAEANFLAAWAVLQPGDEVITFTPSYPQVAGHAVALGAAVRLVPLRPDAAWSLDREAFQAALSPQTRLIVVCDPNNPTAQWMPLEDRAYLLAEAARVGAIVLVDEVYRWADLNDNPHPSWWAPDAPVIVTGGLSKGFGLAGLRLGWLVASPEIRAKAVARHDFSTLAPSTPADWLARTLLDDPDRVRHLQARLREPILAARSQLADWVAGHEAHVTWTPPQAGAFALLRFREPRETLTWAAELCRVDEVLVIPGEDFGCPGSFRLGLNASPETLSTGLTAISQRLSV